MSANLIGTTHYCERECNEEKGHVPRCARWDPKDPRAVNYLAKPDGYKDRLREDAFSIFCGLVQRHPELPGLDVARLAFQHASDFDEVARVEMTRAAERALNPQQPRGRIEHAHLLPPNGGQLR